MNSPKSAKREELIYVSLEKVRLSSKDKQIGLEIAMNNKPV